MLAEIIELVQDELDLVEAKINKELKLRVGHAANFAHLDFNPMDRYLRPALVLLSARMFSPIDNKILSLAGVMQFVHMASIVHLGITDESKNVSIDEGFDVRDGSQFPVLVGDYLYGNFFALICDGDILYLLEPVSEIICYMNEGSILNKKAEDNDVMQKEKALEIIKLETAESIAGACRLGASLTNATESELKIVNNFGMHLGMAYGIIERNMSFDRACEYLKKAHKELVQIKDSPAKRALEKLINSLLTGEIAIQKRMVG